MQPPAVAAPSERRIEALLEPYLTGVTIPADLPGRCKAYLDLLLRWNAKTNLTAVRNPEQFVTRQLGESLFAARLVADTGTLLDFGSGAGLPGLPVQWLRPGVRVTLAESQQKKSSFLREAVRTLGLSCEVWAGRVQDLPDVRRFSCVAMRAVDQSDAMLDAALERIEEGGHLLRFLAREHAASLPGWEVTADLSIPGGGRVALLERSGHVPRGTS